VNRCVYVWETEEAEKEPRRVWACESVCDLGDGLNKTKPDRTQIARPGSLESVTLARRKPKTNPASPRSTSNSLGMCESVCD
jgi:hypothetical protein